MLEDKIRRSLELLKGLPRVSSSLGELPLIVNFSGGKDSTTCLLLALEASDNVECMYFDSGFELPITLKYVRERCRDLGVKLHVSHPGRDRVRHRVLPKSLCLLQDYILHYGYFPSAARRWCGIWCKQRPARVYIRRVWGKNPLHKIVGIRIDESTRRKYVYGSAAAQKKYGGKYIRPDRECVGTKLVYPILDWTEEDVLKFLNAREVELHQGYKLFGVSGCKWCPVHKPETVAKIAAAYPGLYDDFIEVEEKIDSPAWTHKKIWLRDVVAGRFDK